MSSEFPLAPHAIGPVFPFMLIYFTYMAGTSLFIILAWLRSYFKSYTVRELRFLQRIYDATVMVSTLAILTGMIGTCLGLLEVLPVLSDISNTNSGSSVLGRVLRPLQNVWASTIAGLTLGGLWGEILMFILRPYLRPGLMQVVDPTQPETDFPIYGPAGSPLVDSDLYDPDGDVFEEDDKKV